jgi:ATP-binding cassette subfamily A (ABC1) protein 3
MRDSERTIVLTTHHLEEVEELADRTAIMAKGKLLAVGTNDFIKQNFGIGFHLTLSKKN